MIKYLCGIVFKHIYHFIILILIILWFIFIMAILLSLDRHISQYHRQVISFPL